MFGNFKQTHTAYTWHPDECVCKVLWRCVPRKQLTFQTKMPHSFPLESRSHAQISSQCMFRHSPWLIIQFGRRSAAKKKEDNREKSRRGLMQWYVPWLRYERMTSRQTFIQVWCPQKIHRHLLDSYCRERLKQYLVSLSGKDHRHRGSHSQELLPRLFLLVVARFCTQEQLLGKSIVPRESWQWTQEG